jgi:hypothetical protein
MDVEVAHVLPLGLAGRDRTQRRAADESHLDVVREAMDAEEPAMRQAETILKRFPGPVTLHVSRRRRLVGLAFSLARDGDLRLDLDRER